MNITLGVPRIQEIINCANNIKGPSMTIYLEEDKRFGIDHAHKLISMLEFTTLKHVARVSEIYYDPDPDTTIIEDDKDLIWNVHDAEEKKLFSPWVLRIQIDLTLLGRKGLRLSDIKDKINHFFREKPLDLIASIESADPIILRLRMKNEAELSPEEITSQFHSLKKIE
jgi:DNA-directed RNA polymerase II subunit RPB1